MLDANRSSVLTTPGDLSVGDHFSMISWKIMTEVISHHFLFAKERKQTDSNSKECASHIFSAK